MAKVYFIDVTNRDGVQTARISLSKFQKTMVNWYLSQLGIHQSEFGFPFLGHERNYVLGNLALGRKGAFGGMVLEGWCRAVEQDVEGGLTTGVKHLNISIPTSDQMIVHKFGGRLEREGIVREMVEAARAARQGGVETLGVNAEDASRTDMEFLVEFGQAAREAGADRLRYCDTIGYETPDGIRRRVHELASRLKYPIELHCHNDLGMAVANSVAGAAGAVDAGVDAYINTSINGIGERAGQADLLSCIMALRFGRELSNGYNIGDPLDLTVAWRLTRYTAEAFGVPIPINQPGVGANAFAHESGIHADGALKDRHNYELYDYQLIGRVEEVCEPTGRTITTGEYGGMAGFKHVYEHLGIAFADEDTGRYVLNLVQYANAHNQFPLTDDELRFIAMHPEEVRQILTIKPPAPKGSGELRSVRSQGKSTVLLH
ncbi:MAG TPA: homocitrate synthase [Dehalococcoidia bacterium]|nr:homocitrate synthase [Dehalococcoidia bacterium]